MIKVDRYRKEEGKIIQPSEKWFKDARKKTTIAVAEGGQHRITELYRDDQVKMALKKLFYDKCAYCESSTLHCEWDVEHFRPKGRVGERPDHPGYYWLAYTWENLYLSCKFCNQKRKESPRFEDSTTSAAQGKCDQFPVVDERYRAMKPNDDLTQEHPLLLDPCKDDPEKFFSYNPLGEIQPLDTTDKRALETIRICHLEHRELRIKRVKIIKQVSKILNLIGIARREENAELEDQLIQLLNGFTDSSSAYAGAARAVVRDPEIFPTE